MHCRTCDDLVAAYTSAVDLYTAVAQDIGTLVGDDFRLASKDAERLRLACRDADNALSAHFRQDSFVPSSVQKHFARLLNLAL
jgi:hypothetical protein